MRNLKIHNFGPVKEADINIKNVNLFIGQQSVGKSTIAKLITIFTDYLTVASLIVQNEKSFESFLKSYDLDVYANDDYSIEYDLIEDDLNLHLNITKGNLTCKCFYNGEACNDKEIIFGRVSGQKLNHIYHKDVVERINSALKEGISNKEEFNSYIINVLDNSIYIPAERNIYSVVNKLQPALLMLGGSAPSTLLRFMVEIGKAEVAYPVLDMPVLNLIYQHENSQNFFKLKDDSDKKFPLVNGSSGIQSATPLLLLLEYALNKKEYGSFVIEEPECNLFPSKQVELLNRILEIPSAERILTITTHSPYLLSAFNNYLFAGTIITENTSLKDKITEKFPGMPVLYSKDCSVYSLGEDINDGVYCKSLMDEETGMIDVNSLDVISGEMSLQFDQLQNLLVENME